jgi:hypothetical protein
MKECVEGISHISSKLPIIYIYSNNGRLISNILNECDIFRVFRGQMGHAVAQLVEALCYIPEGCGFCSRWCHWKLSLTKSFRPHYGPGVDSASNRNEYQEYFLAVKA